jgi:hypothetical protein
MIQYRVSAAQAFQAAGRVLTARELHTWLMGMLIQEWVSPGTPFGATEVDLAMDETDCDSSESEMAEAESEEEDGAESPAEEEEEAEEEEAEEEEAQD